MFFNIYESPKRLPLVWDFSFNAMDGWVKLYRQIRQWRWYSDSNVKSLFIHCLLSANTTDADWHEITIKKGTFVTSLASLSVELGLSLQKLRTAIKKLESSGEIDTKSTNKFTIITICKWESYQCSNDTEQQTNNKQITNNQQTNNKQITTNKNNKNKRIEEEENIYRDDNVAFATDQPNSQPAKKSLEERQKDFYNEIAQYVGKYDREMLRAFYDYWCEPNQKNTKMRKELEKTWSTGGRLATWYRRQNESQNNNNQQLNNKNNGNNQQNYRKEGLSDAEILEAVAGGFALFNASKNSDNQ